MAENSAAITEQVTTEEKSPDNTEGNSEHLTKSQRKRQQYEQLVTRQKRQRRETKARQKEARKQASDCADSERISKKDKLAQIKARMTEGLVTGQRICVDLSLGSYMSDKESSRLAQQLCRLYGANRAAEKPAHIYFTGVDKSGFLYRECVRKNNGFENYIVEMSEKPHVDIFPKDEIVYLTPDSPNVLESVDKDKVYIIGGLVDESITKNITSTRAESAGIQTARLPIKEYMTKSSHGTHFSHVLTVNQVFSILLTYTETKDWSKTLGEIVPQRKGYLVQK